MAEVEEGDFGGLVQVEGWWSGVWFVPGEVLFRAVMRVANCALVSGGCTLVVQRSFPVVFEVICRGLTLIFALVGPLSLGGVLLVFTPYE